MRDSSTRAAALLSLVLLVSPACEYPRDADDTLKRVQGGVLRVGVSENPPWVHFDDEKVSGIEPALVRRWAEGMGARIEWVRGTEAELFEALRLRALHLVLIGLTNDTPWASRIALSQVYLKARLRVAPAPDHSGADWRGQTVGVDPRRVWLAALVSAADGTPLPADARAPTSIAVAGYDFELKAMGREPTGPVLATERHVLAAVPGENAFLLALDRFLLAEGARLATAAATDARQ